MKEYIVKTEEETKEFARLFASALKPGDVVVFRGDLGSGKTFIAREIIRFFHSQEQVVPSPTFTILQTYGNIYHYDLYRIKSENELYEIGLEEALSGENICLIEWHEIAHHILPKNRCEISIKLDGDLRVITLTNF